MAGDAQNSTKPAKPNSTITAAGFTGADSVASFKVQVSRTSRKVGFGSPQRQNATFLFHEFDHFRVGHCLSRIALVTLCQFRREPKSNQLSTNYGFREHG